MTFPRGERSFPPATLASFIILGGWCVESWLRAVGPHVHARRIERLTRFGRGVQNSALSILCGGPGAVRNGWGSQCPRGDHENTFWPGGIACDLNFRRVCLFSLRAGRLFQRAVNRHGDGPERRLGGRRDGQHS